MHLHRSENQHSESQRSDNQRARGTSFRRLLCAIIALVRGPCDRARQQRWIAFQCDAPRIGDMQAEHCYAGTQQPLT